MESVQGQNASSPPVYSRSYLRAAATYPPPCSHQLSHHRFPRCQVHITVALTERQRIRAGVHAVLTASKNKSGKTVDERLAPDIIVVINGDSKAITDKELSHRHAMVNRGNALVK